MPRNTADCKADVERFVSRVVSAEVVWHLGSECGVANCESNDERAGDEEPQTVLLFFSDEAYARRCQKSHFDDHEIVGIPLFDFLYRWLPGMSGDGVLAGPNWNQDLIGLEVDPFDLREQVKVAMPPELQESYLVQFHRLTSEA